MESMVQSCLKRVREEERGGESTHSVHIYVYAYIFIYLYRVCGVAAGLMLVTDVVMQFGRSSVQFCQGHFILHFNVN